MNNRCAILQHCGSVTCTRRPPPGASSSSARPPCCTVIARTIAEAAIAQLAPAALAKAIELELEAGEPVSVRADARLLGILLRNLLDNAVRYSPARTAVRVRVGRRNGTPFVGVADEGRGVSPAERAQLGRRFHRLAGGEAPGTGLGLSIVARIADLHGATVTFEEAAPGTGLAATVSFESG
jgi:two-component system sensor histidine kinase QseC